MRCRQARKLLNPLLEGELGHEAAAGVEGHLKGCPDCARRFQSLKELVRELSRMPQVRPTEAETARLQAHLREAMSSHPDRASRFPLRWAAAAASLAAVVAAAFTWTFLSGRRTPKAVETAEKQTASLETVSGGTTEASALSLQEIYPGSAEELVVRPALVLSGREYSPGELQAYDEDIGPRMAFYSAYWYPVAGDTQSPFIQRLQEQLVADLARQAERAGLNPDELRRAIAAGPAESGSVLLPCRAELARVLGREVWLLSFSGPEDYLLFLDPQVPAALHLATRGGQESLKFSQSILQELAARLIPRGGELPAPAACPEGVPREAELSERQGDDTGRARQGGEENPAVPSEEEFQAFLRDVAAQGNPAEVVKALQKMNYEQLLLLLQGDWMSLAAKGVDLSDLLLPPRRLVAVDRVTVEVIWKAP